MSTRPKFDQINNYDEFSQYYWYRSELKEICRNLKIDHSGTKKELEKNIREYFNGNLVPKRKRKSARKIVTDVDLNTPLLDCGYAMNARFRELFSKYTGVNNFKFNANMATVWRKVKEEQDKNFTIGDMIDVYYGRKDYAQYDNSSCQWNQFYKDFCADNRNKNCKSKLKAASVL